MLFSNEERCLYGKSQLLEVICQLRFPTILSVTATEPVTFQEGIRQDYPRFEKRLERLAPRPTPQPDGTVQMQPQEPVMNFGFVSADGHWKANITNQFLALSSNAYSGWENFAARLDKLLAAFISTYHPAYFERIGLRYVNAISRDALGLADVMWNELIEQPYLGVLGEEDAVEGAVTKSATDVEMAIGHGCRMKVHAGPGVLRRPNQTQAETRFIFDMDLSMLGKLQGVETAGALSTLHNNATSVFRGAITQKLHDALEPIE
ncbi:MAG: TIGR04255 family protein [Oscillospiraceae bacterium]|nr:TIGR04255 family protein [Oscillospiraceae bacterium]